MRDPATTRLFRNVLCKDGRTRDLAVRAGRFVDPNELNDDAEAIDLDSLLALPAFIEGHIPLDKSFVGVGWRPHRPADDLGERLTIEKQLLAGTLPVQERADANASAAVAAPPCNRRLVQRGEIIAAPTSRFETLLSSFDKSGPRS